LIKQVNTNRTANEASIVVQHLAEKRRLVVFRTPSSHRPSIDESDRFNLGDLYPIAGIVSIATYLVVECLLG
jgi:hypothetical protein